MKRYSIITGVMVAMMMIILAAGARADTPATAPAASQPVTAHGVTQQLIDRVLVVLQDKTLALDQRRQKVYDIAYDEMDFETLARLTLGRNWRPLNSAQRADFIQEYKKHLAATYGHSMDSYTNEAVNLTADQQETNGDVTILTQVLGDKDGIRQEVAKVNYRLRQKQGQWKVIDVVIDGVSLMANFRSQFQEVIDQNGFEKLMKLLREKNAGNGH